MFFLTLDRGSLLRLLALISGALALALYCWGLLHLLGAVLAAEDGGADSAPLRPCRSVGGGGGGGQVSGYSVDYVPLRFVCETRGGGSYLSDQVPAYVNPGALGFALAGTALGVGAGYEAESRARRAVTPANEEPEPTS
ncbi:hypothetical protein AB0945_29735 [Streptomyces sp. NPDC005474]|uniref:hypothetical protein n=1 Tax=Streptomyces sp. NPDC005474 TaxID=3154878 RepID=UPI003454565E